MERTKRPVLNPALRAGLNLLDDGDDSEEKANEVFEFRPGSTNRQLPNCQTSLIKHVESGGLWVSSYIWRIIIGYRTKLAIGYTQPKCRRNVPLSFSAVHLPLAQNTCKAGKVVFMDTKQGRRRIRRTTICGE